MIALPARATLLVLCVTVLATQTDADEPGKPKLRPEYTAFPDLKPLTLTRMENGPDGIPHRVPNGEAVLQIPTLPVLLADAPLLRKVQYEQARAGLDYLTDAELLKPRGVPNDFLEWRTVVMPLFRLAAGLEEKVTDRVPWYETRVRLLKDIERLVHIHVRNGTTPPHSLNVVRFYHLQAEAELVELLAEVKRAGPAPAPPPMVPPQQPGEIAVRPPMPVRPVPLEQAPLPRRIYPSGYTAFPELTWDGPRWDRRDQREDSDRFGRPPPSIPALPADASQLRKLQHESVLEAFVFLDEVSQIQRFSGPGPSPVSSLVPKHTSSRRFSSRIRRSAWRGTRPAFVCSKGGSGTERLACWSEATHLTSTTPHCSHTFRPRAI